MPWHRLIRLGSVCSPGAPTGGAAPFEDDAEDDYIEGADQAFLALCYARTVTGDASSLMMPPPQRVLSWPWQWRRSSRSRRKRLKQVCLFVERGALPRSGTEVWHRGEAH